MPRSTKDIGGDLEDKIAQIFESWGWETQTRTKPKDEKGIPHEIDVLATRLVGSAQITVAVECKNWSEGQVGIKDARDFLTKLSCLQIKEGIFITTSAFSEDSSNFLDAHNITACGSIDDFLRRVEGYYSNKNRQDADEMGQNSRIKNYYEILGVRENAEQKIIEYAYRAKSLLYHPDKNLDKMAWANEKMTEINEAYAVLSDPERRKKYDEELVKHTNRDHSNEHAYTEIYQVVQPDSRNLKSLRTSLVNHQKTSTKSIFRFYPYFDIHYTCLARKEYAGKEYSINSNGELLLDPSTGSIVAVESNGPDGPDIRLSNAYDGTLTAPRAQINIESTFIFDGIRTGVSFENDMSAMDREQAKNTALSFLASALRKSIRYYTRREPDGVQTTLTPAADDFRFTVKRIYIPFVFEEITLLSGENYYRFIQGVTGTQTHSTLKCNVCGKVGNNKRIEVVCERCARLACHNHAVKCEVCQMPLCEKCAVKSGRILNKFYCSEEHKTLEPRQLQQATENHESGHRQVEYQTAKVRSRKPNLKFLIPIICVALGSVSAMIVLNLPVVGSPVTDNPFVTDSDRLPPPQSPPADSQPESGLQSESPSSPYPPNTEIPDDDVPTPIPNGPDYYPPSSDITIEGIKRCPSVLRTEKCWYYNDYPIAMFAASDDASGIKYIKAWYKVEGDERCKENECLLKPGDTLVLDEYNTVNKGEMKLIYFAVDNSGNAEEQHTLSLWVDITKPQVSVMRIHTETKDNLPTVSGCEINLDIAQNCVTITVAVNETLTFDLLISDMTSGLDAAYYKVVKSYELSKSHTMPWILVGDASDMNKVDVSFDKKGAYYVQLKATDVAGNESDLKTYLVKVV